MVTIIKRRLNVQKVNGNVPVTLKSPRSKKKNSIDENIVSFSQMLEVDLIGENFSRVSETVFEH